MQQLFSEMNAEQLEAEAYGRNVLGKPLEPCCRALNTGFYKDGFCRTDKFDSETHSVCAHLTKEFIKFSQEHGEDLEHPNHRLDFPGLMPGDKWCVCANKWKQALKNKVAPPIFLEATQEQTLKFISLGDLKEHVSKAKKDA